MKFKKKELKNEISELVKKGWLDEDFVQTDFIDNITKLEFTSPKKADVFNAFTLFDPAQTRILILGKDPYPDNKYPNKADGLAFSQNGQKPVDSLKNIFKAIAKYREKMCIKENRYNNWDTNLKEWANNNQILLLNTSLTYEEKNQKNHQAIWEPFVKKIITKLLTCNSGKLVVFLWGQDAQKLFHETIYKITDKNNEIDKTEEIKRDLLVLATSHPSNMGGAVKKGFCYEAPNHFKACDEFLFLGKKEKEKYTWLDFPEK